MIQLKRGKTVNWRALSKPIAAGQPGYDKDKHKIKIGDGETLWSALPYASGLSEEDILMSEDQAKLRHALDPEDGTLFTYGTEYPDADDTVGKVYFQHYDAEPETDYVMEFGTNGIWTYRKWHSGYAECCGTITKNMSVKEPFENKVLNYSKQSAGAINYPFTFTSIPNELATLSSQSGVSWLAGKAKNSTTVSGEYIIVSPDSLDSASYGITIQAKGYWR